MAIISKNNYIAVAGYDKTIQIFTTTLHNSTHLHYNHLQNFTDFYTSSEYIYTAQQNSATLLQNPTRLFTKRYKAPQSYFKL